MPESSTSAAPLAVEIRGLSHTYPASRRRRPATTGNPAPVSGQPVLALDQVTFDIRPGEIFGVLGPNGGGKTTLFRILATLLKPTQGDVRVLGHDLAASPALVRHLIGVVFQSPSLDGKLSARENLRHQAELYGLAGPAVLARIEESLAYFGLADRSDEPVERHSGGMRRRVELAKVLLHDPQLLLLDEPSTGLDPGARADLWRQLEQWRAGGDDPGRRGGEGTGREGSDDARREPRPGRARAGRTVALTTHLMDEADRCDRLAVIAQGKLVAVDTPTNLKARIGGDVVVLTPMAGDGAARVAAQAGAQAALGGAGLSARSDMASAASVAGGMDAAMRGGNAATMGGNAESPPASDPSSAAGRDAAADLCARIHDRFGPWPAGAGPRVVAGRVRVERADGLGFVTQLAQAMPGSFAHVAVGQPTLEDVFLHLTGHTLYA